MFVSSKVKDLFGSEFFRDVTVVMSGNALAYVIAIGTSPIITRLFRPEDFGIFALFSTTCTVIGSVSMLCYDRAILLPKEEPEATSLIVLSGTILVGFSLLAWGILSSLRIDLARILGCIDFSSWLIIIPLGVVLDGSARILRYWNLRCKKFANLAIARTSDAFVAATVKIMVGFLVGSCAWGLVTGYLVGIGVSLVLLFSNGLQGLMIGVKCSSLADMKELLIKYRRFALYGSPNALIKTFSNSAVVYILSTLFSSTVVGYYSLGNRILAQPIGVLSDSVSNVFFQKAAYSVARNEGICARFSKTLWGLFFVGCIPFGLIGIFGKMIFGFVFGENWITAGVYAQIMTPWLFMVYLNGPTNVVFEVLQKQNVRLFLNSSKGVCSILVLLLGGAFAAGPEMILTCFVCLNLVIETVTLFIAYRLLGAKE